MGLFATDWRKQVERLLPSFKRGTSTIDWLTSLVVPLFTNGTTWDAFDTEIRKRARFNGQKMVLQAALNDIFGVISAPYIIVESQHSVVVNVFIYNEGEGLNRFSYNEGETTPPLYTFNESETPDTFDFLVKIPSGIHTAELERRVTEETRTYKLAGKTFDVITY